MYAMSRSQAAPCWNSSQVCAKGDRADLEALVQLGEARLIARGEEVETQAGHVLEPLVGLHTSQPKGRPAFEREQIARVAKELGDDLIGFGRWRRAGVPRRWALGGWRLGSFGDLATGRSSSRRLLGRAPCEVPDGSSRRPAGARFFAAPP